jgi:hypothetical protein
MQRFITMFTTTVTDCTQCSPYWLIHSFPTFTHYFSDVYLEIIFLCKSPTQSLPLRYSKPNDTCIFYFHQGCAVAQAVSRWLPTAVARVRVQAACGVCGGQSDTGAGFLRLLRFPLPIIIPQISLSSSLSPGAGTIGLLVAAVSSGPNWTPPPNMPI